VSVSADMGSSDQDRDMLSCSHMVANGQNMKDGNYHNMCWDWMVAALLELYRFSTVCLTWVEGREQPVDKRRKQSTLFKWLAAGAARSIHSTAATHP